MLQEAAGEATRVGGRNPLEVGTFLLKLVVAAARKEKPDQPGGEGTIGQVELHGERHGQLAERTLLRVILRMEGKTSRLATGMKDTKNRTLALGLLGNRVTEEWTRASQEGSTLWEWGEEVLTAMDTALTHKWWGGVRCTRIEEAGEEKP